MLAVNATAGPIGADVWDGRELAQEGKGQGFIGHSELPKGALIFVTLGLGQDQGRRQVKEGEEE